VPETEVHMSDEEWRSKLTPERYEVLRCSATEPAWSGEYLHVDKDGVFRCAGCGAELFSTADKFDSGSGWPSFDRAKSAGAIVEKRDRSHFMVRTEITCARCGGHLGHVFPDGPTDTGMRYCVNSLALDFDPEQPDTAREPAEEAEDKGAATGT
jgi:peptide-methionine (R)-S-oxide reductase